MALSRLLRPTPCYGIAPHCADLLLGRFADAWLETLSDSDLDIYEILLEQADQDLYAWIAGERPWPTSLNHPLTRRLTVAAAGGALSG